MKQIQYAPLAEAPQRTDPTVAQAMGWSPSMPAQVRHHERGRRNAALKQTHEQSIGATVFSVEKWAIPLGGGVEPPDDPRLGRRRLLATAGMPASAYTERSLAVSLTPVPSVVIPHDPRVGRRLQLAIATEFEADFGVETIVPVMSWTGSWTDATIRQRRAPLQGLDLTAPAATLNAPQTPTGWWPAALEPRRPALATWPRMTVVGPSSFETQPLAWRGVQPELARRAAAAPARQPLAFVDPLEQLAIPFGWPMVSAPDTTRRAALPVAHVPAVTWSQAALEQFAVPALAWHGLYPATCRPQKLTTAAAVPGGCLTERDLQVVVPALSWHARYPDATRRPSLAIAKVPACARGEAVEQFAPTRLWSVQAPSATRRSELGRQHYPASTRGEAVEQFARIGLWSIEAPSTTRRLTLARATYPSVFHVLMSLAPALVPDLGEYFTATSEEIFLSATSDALFLEAL